MKKVKLRHSLTAVLLGLAVSATASYPAIRSISQERAIEQAEIERLDQQLVEALLNRDFPALQALLADDFEIYTVSMGVLTKEEWLHNIQRRSLNYMVVETREQPQFQGKQLSRISYVTGDFWGNSAEAKPIETTIRTIGGKDNRQIKCIVVKHAA